MLKNAGDCQSLSTVDRSAYQLLISHLCHKLSSYLDIAAFFVRCVDGVAVFCEAELGAELMRGDASRVRTGYRKVAGTKTLRV